MDGLVHKDAQLNLRFRSYSPICAPRRGNAIDLNLPFQHLASDGIYVHVAEGEADGAAGSSASGGHAGACVAPGGPEEGGGGLLPARGASGPLRGPGMSYAVF